MDSCLYNFASLPDWTKSGAPFFFAGSHQSDSYRFFWGQKIWNTKMAYGKNTCIFLCFFAFLSIPLHSRFLFLIPFYSASFLCFPSAIQKLVKMNAFQCNFLHKQPSVSNSQFGFQVVILHKMFKMGRHVYTFYLYTSLLDRRWTCTLYPNRSHTLMA